jgi:hypothetical protein
MPVRLPTVVQVDPESSKQFADNILEKAYFAYDGNDGDDISKYVLEFAI